MQYTFILTASKQLPKQCTDYQSGKSKQRKSVGVRIPDDAVLQVLALPNILACSVDFDLLNCRFMRWHVQLQAPLTFFLSRLKYETAACQHLGNIHDRMESNTSTLLMVKVTAMLC